MRSVPAFTLVLLAVTARPEAAAQASATRNAPSIAELSASLESVAERTSRAVVQIAVTVYSPGQGNQQRTGSGVILDPAGYIVTNAHVVENARRVQVMLAYNEDAESEGRRGSILRPRAKPVGAQVVYADEETDIAVLKAEAHGLPFLELADSDGVRQGQIVLAFGSPLGLENSVTMGVVSATPRQLQADAPVIYLQTDAPIHPGNSGGPLADAEGRVIGINTLILTPPVGTQGVGFAVPSNIVRTIYEQVRRTGQVRRGEIGVRAQTITPLLASGLKLPRDWGVVLSDVYPLSPAARAGLQIGDVITRLDGKVMENGRQFRVNVYRRGGGGERVKLEVLRGQETLEIEVPVVDRADDPDRFAQLVTPERNLIARLGVLAINLDPQIATLLPSLRNPEGVVVAARASESSAAGQNEILPGDVIRGLNGLPVARVEELRTAVDGLDAGTPVVLHLERGGQLLYVALEIP